MSALRDEFIRLLTVDSEHHDRRRKDFNQALFMSPDDPLFPGNQAWTHIDFWMVMEKFDKAVKNVAARGNTEKRIPTSRNNTEEGIGKTDEPRGHEDRV